MISAAASAVTRFLADHFDAVVGADVASSMLSRAQSLHADRDRITFVLNRAPNLEQFATASFDVIYCCLVLQPIRPAIVEGYIAEFLRVLTPGGVLTFQLPGVTSVDSRRGSEEAPVVGSLKQRIPQPIVRAWRRLKYRFLTDPRVPVIEMFGMNRSAVEAVIARSGGRLLWAKPDHCHGPDGLGFEYWVTKP